MPTAKSSSVLHLSLSLFSVFLSLQWPVSASFSLVAVTLSRCRRRATERHRNLFELHVRQVPHPRRLRSVARISKSEMFHSTMFILDNGGQYLCTQRHTLRLFVLSYRSSKFLEWRNEITIFRKNDRPSKHLIFMINILWNKIDINIKVRRTFTTRRMFKQHCQTNDIVCKTFKRLQDI